MLWLPLLLWILSFFVCLVANVLCFQFMAPRFIIYQTLCERLETFDRIMDATECFLQMSSELGHETNSERAKWINGEFSCPLRKRQVFDCSPPDFKLRCCEKLEHIGDRMMSFQQHDQAIFQYSVALSLNPPNSQILFAKRSKALNNVGLWEEALNDANEVCYWCLTPVRAFNWNASDHHARPIVTTGLRDQTCDFTCCRTLS